MRTRIDVDDYQLLTTAQRAEVDAYLAELGRPIPEFGVYAVEATAEGTVRLERHLAGGVGRGAVFYVTSECRTGRCCNASAYARHCTHHDFVTARETFRPALPPPWLAWPEEADPCE